MFLFEIDFASPHFSQYLSQIFDDETSTEARQEGESAQDPSEKIMTPWTFNVKFPYGTPFTFRSLMFAARKDGNLELLTQGTTKASCTGFWTRSISFGQFIYIRQSLLRFESLCRVKPSRR
jgi:hypothetical protein